MRQIAKETSAAYEGRLERAQVPAAQRPDYHKWTRFYLDFCQKYGHAPRSPASVGPFLAKLAAKNQSEEQRQEAAKAINLLIGLNPEPNSRLQTLPRAIPINHAVPPKVQNRPVTVALRPVAQPPAPRAQTEARFSATSSSSAALPTSAPATNGPIPGRGASWEKEYRDLEASIKLRNYSPKTFEAYRLWVGKFQAFVRSRPACHLGLGEVRGFLSELAVRYGVAASTQNQAFRPVEG